jgi:NDP-sugar pyrophosphorylase family protein
MKAIILAGGRGSRLGQLTESNPKPLVKISGTPILEYLIKNASEAGIKEYVVCTGYLGYMIQEYFGDGSKFGVDIGYAEQKSKSPEQPIFSAREYIDDEKFCCFCGDNILTTPQIRKIIGSLSLDNADAVFTLESNPESDITKKVKVKNGRIYGSGNDINDPVLVYNLCMKTSFFNELHDTVKDKEDTAFAPAMDVLAKRYNICALDIPFMNINFPEDIRKAETFLRQDF